MGRKQNVVDYVYGESVGIYALLRTRRGDVLSPATVETTFIVTDEATSQKLVTIAPDEITTSDAPTGEVLIAISPERYRALVPEKLYRYDLWTVQGSDRLHQASGQFCLRKASRP